MPPIGEESDEQTRAFRKNQMNAEEADQARGAADRYDPKRSSLRTWMFAIARKGTSSLVESKSAEVMLMERRGRIGLGGI
jgi:hypothetical protein